MPTDAIDLELAGRLSSAVDVADGIEEILNAILLQLDGRAIGLWRAGDDTLHLLGFAARNDMPAEVRDGFRAATGTVALSMKRLGIVKAAVAREPAVSRLDDGTRDGDDALSGSPGWLDRFDARSSLAVPVFDGETVVAVLAVSSREEFDPATGGGRRLIALSDALVLFRPQ